MLEILYISAALVSLIVGVPTLYLQIRNLIVKSVDRLPRTNILSSHFQQYIAHYQASRLELTPDNLSVDKSIESRLEKALAPFSSEELEEVITGRTSAWLKVLFAPISSSLFLVLILYPTAPSFYASLDVSRLIFYILFLFIFGSFAFYQTVFSFRYLRFRFTLVALGLRFEKRLVRIPENWLADTSAQFLAEFGRIAWKRQHSFQYKLLRLGAAIPAILLGLAGLNVLIQDFTSDEFLDGISDVKIVVGERFLGEFSSLMGFVVLYIIFLAAWDFILLCGSFRAKRAAVARHQPEKIKGPGSITGGSDE
jgi:hypothetical protein